MIGLPPVKIRAAARNRLSVPSVTMNGCSPASATSPPLTSPHAMPSSRPAATHTTIGTPAAIMVAETTAASAAVGPTERSIPPEMMTSVMPIAMHALIDDCWRMLTRLRSVRNVGARAANTAKITIRPMSVPASRRLKRAKRCRVAGAAVAIRPLREWRGA